MTNIIRRLLDAFVIWFPLMSKKSHNCVVNRERQRTKELQERYEIEKEQDKKKIDSILDRVGRIDWRQEDNERYAMMITFEPRMIGRGYCSSDELQFLAQAFGRRVEAEIASARFIQKADMLEREKYRHIR